MATAIYQKEQNCSSSSSNERTEQDGTAENQNSELKPPITHPKSIDWSFPSQGDLYGRKNEQYRLLGAFQRQTSSSSKPELVVLSGNAGVGKTELANTLRRHISDRDGFFITGKLPIDHLQYPVPYAPFVTALTDFSKRAVEKGPEFTKFLKNEIAQAVDTLESRLLLDMIPALKEFLDCSGDTTSCRTGGTDAHQRLRVLFCKFMRSICSPEHPLVLLIDDLQWADSASLALLKELSAAQNMDGLFLLCTCRGNEVGFQDEAATMLRDLDKQHVKITEIKLSNLSEKTVNNIVADVLELDHAASKSLAEVLYIQTKGNIFHVLELLRSLCEEGTIYMDAGESRWKWSESKTSILKVCDNLPNLLAAKLSRLPWEVQELLKVASCIGSEFEEYTLSFLLPEINISEVLMIAKRNGIVAEDRDILGTFRFVHDRFHQAAYSLIPHNEKDRFHLTIGRRLMEVLKEIDDGTSRHIFVLINQMSRGMKLIQDQLEKDKVAGLCLQAGEKSMKASAFTVAATYYQQGIDFLRIKDPQTPREAERQWKDEYHLSLKLYCMAAEAEFINGNFEVSEHLVKSVLKNARSLRDKIGAYTTQVYALGARHRLQEAIITGLSVLNNLGETFPQNEPSKAHVFVELKKTMAMLYHKTDADLVSLPLMLDDDKLAAMSILNLIATYSFMASSNYSTLFACRMVQLTLRYGISAISSFAFAHYGVIRCRLKDFSGGHRYGQVALKVLDRFNILEWTPRVYTFFHGFINHWTVPLRDTVKGLKDATMIGLQTGDIEFSMVAANFYVCKMISTSEDLIGLEREIIGVRRLMLQYKQQTWLSIVSVPLQYVHNLRGKSCDPTVLTGDALDQEAAILQAQTTQKNMHFLQSIYFYRLVLTVTFNNYSLAYELANKTRVGNAAAFRNLLLYFYTGISAVGLHQQTKKKIYLKKARACLKDLKKLSRHAATANCLNKVLLLEAELATAEGEIEAALVKYRVSIETAKAEKFVHEQAIALECAGRALLHQGMESSSETYLLRAYECYKKWGAKAKTEQMVRCYPSLQGKTKQMAYSSQELTSDKKHVTF